MPKLAVVGRDLSGVDGYLVNPPHSRPSMHPPIAAIWTSVRAPGMGLEKDLPPGEQLVVCFRPFIEHRASSSLSPKTIRQHVDNLWLLGGEIIRDLNYGPSQRKVAVHKLLRDAIGTDGGPLIYGSEDAQYSLDSTCRKLHRFLSQPQL